MNGVYVHIPFCKTICSYCDFCKMFYIKKWIKPYLEALNKEIDTNYKEEEVKTLYIGGGTPNSLSLDELEELFTILKKINLSKDYEYTIECNIELLTLEQIKLFKKYGINRVSLGVQTFNEKFLQFLNRNHSKEEVINKVKLLKDNDINNINIDLIYALPGETIDDVKNDINILKELDINHISTYSLIIEPNTILNNLHIENIDEDLDYEMYETIIDELKDYNHYETSNFAKEGYESKHNLNYWNNNRYYGFGLGASGYIHNNRYDNTKSMKKYLNGEYIDSNEILSFNETVENHFILGLRKVNGINKEEFIKRYNIDINDLDVVKDLIKKGKLIDDGINIKLNKEYLYTCNNILINFLGVDYEKRRI